MEDWKERYDKFEKRFWLKMKGRVYYDNYETVTIKEGWNIEVKRFIEQELSKAREEGYGEGVKDGMKGKVFKKVHLTEEYRPFKNRGELEEFLKNTRTKWDEIFKVAEEAEWRED